MLATLHPLTPDPITLRNRANARHSTGPRTPEGKATVSRNATKHGLLSNAIIATAFERQADWEAHLADFLDHLDPFDHPEHVLAEHIAFLHWRRARLHRYESAAIDAQLQAFEDSLQQQDAPTTATPPAAPAGPLGQPATANPQPKQLTEQQIAVRRALCELPEPKTMDRIMRYENQIAKDLERTRYRLDQLKATRAQRLRALSRPRPEIGRGTAQGHERALAAIMAEDPRVGQLDRLPGTPHEPCDEAPPLDRAAEDWVAPTAGAAASADDAPVCDSAGSGTRAISAAPVPAPMPAMRSTTGRNAKQSQTVSGTRRPAHASRASRRARRHGG